MNGKPIVFVLLVVLCIALPVFALFGIYLPSIAQYNRLFGSHVTMAYDQATFEGMQTQVLAVWGQMNKTFADYDFATTYNTPWYWEQNYENSLVANRDYFRSLVDRLNQTIKEKEQILAGNKTIMVPYNSWYQQTLEGFRNESKREGGLDWAINGAWYLSFAPMAYWVWWWVIPLEIVLIIIAIIAFVWAFE
jgi:hypothetical protein